MSEKKTISVLFVCMGNICRSPTAEGVFRRLVEEGGLSSRFFIDSAGTHDYHVGKPPDERAQRAALSRNVDISGLRARQVCREDFEEFDHILAMDRDNLGGLLCLCPVKHREKVVLFLDYAPSWAEREVPDPYFGGAQGFQRVLDMVEDASRGLLERICSEWD